MAYLKEFLARIHKQDKKGFDELWHEYSAGDEIDLEEYCQILQALKNSPFAKDFPVEEALLLAGDKLNEPIFAALIDLQTSNSPALAEQAYAFLEKHYGQVPHFQDKIRIVGLKNRTNFQGAITNFLLLNHLQKGKFVFHNGGWGVGEVMNVSMVREQAEIEFEKVSGKRDLSFASALKVLSPLSDDHFLARRFGDPDRLEQEAKEDPVSVIKLLLRDLGPHTALEIKDELIDYVIPSADWNKWWQSAKNRLKKEETIEIPENPKEPFRILQAARSADEKVIEALDRTKGTKEFIDTLYSSLRDHPQIINKEEIRKNLLERVQALGLLSNPSDQLAVLFLREDLKEEGAKEQLRQLLQGANDAVSVISGLEIIAYKKRAAVELKEARPDWQELYLVLLFSAAPATLREYILKENLPSLKESLAAYLERPWQQPEFLLWYLPKALSDKQLPFSDKAGECRLLEAYLLLLSHIEQKSSYKDLVKKMQNLLFEGRFALVRKILEKSSKEFVQEFLLLVSKCHSIADFDSQTLYSLAYVVHPDLNKKARESSATEEDLIWSTQEGMNKLQERLKQIGTVETVENAREIEAARALGDLRENSEFKFALEKRARLQAELKTLSDQLQNVRVITKADIPQGEVGIGSVVTIENSRGDQMTYTLLGPYDADTEKGILAFQSKLAESMFGHKVGEKFSFQNENYRIVAIKSYL